MSSGNIKPIRASKTLKKFSPSGVAPFLQISSAGIGQASQLQELVTSIASIKNDIDQKEEEERIYNKNTTQASLLEKRLQEQMIKWTDDPNYSNLTPEEFDEKWKAYEEKELADLKDGIYGKDPRAWGRFESAYYTIFNNNRRVFRRQRLEKQRVETQINIINRSNDRLKKALNYDWTPTGSVWRYRDNEKAQIEFDLKRYEMVTGRTVSEEDMKRYQNNLDLAIWQGQLEKNPNLMTDGDIDYNKVVEWLNDPKNDNLHGEFLNPFIKQELEQIFKKKRDTQVAQKEYNRRKANDKLFEDTFQRILNWKEGDPKNITHDEIRNEKDTLGNLLSGDQVRALTGLLNKRIDGDPELTGANYLYNVAIRKAVLAGDKRITTSLTKYSLDVDPGGNLVVVPVPKMNMRTILNDPRLTEDTILFVTKHLEDNITSKKEATSVANASRRFDGVAEGFKAKVIGKIVNNESSLRYSRFLYEKEKEFFEKLRDPDNPKSVDELLSEFIDGKKNPDYIFNEDDLVSQKHIVGFEKQVRDVSKDYVAEVGRNIEIKDKGISLGDPIGTTSDGKPVYKHEGENVSEKSTTFKIPGNKWVNVPTIHNGKIYTEIQIQDMYRDKKVTHTSIHDTKEEAIKAADERSKNTRIILNQKPMSYEKALEAGNNLPWDTYDNIRKQELIDIFKQQYPGKDLPSNWDTP